MAYNVTCTHGGSKYWLRSTVWTADPERATKFQTEAEATNHWNNKAKKFSPSSIHRNVRVVEVSE